MPLPRALAQRLAKRGIVNPNSKKKEEIEEEVFAEDYDDVSQAPDPPPPVETSPKKEKPIELIYDDKGIIVHHVTACPNRSNPYHNCNDFCNQTWSSMKFQHKRDLDLKREKMLSKYPLPDDWLEVADPMTSRYYYWHIDSEEVSWFPPNHPRSKITFSADRSNESISGTKSHLNRLKDALGADSINLTSALANQNLNIDDDSEKQRMERKELMKERNRDKFQNKDKIKQRRKDIIENKRIKGGIDPMDPASYSDISVGNWSSGLDQRGMAKTGVDASATGELFQQRPYPSPGDILRANKALDKKEDSEEDDEIDH